ncbi:SCR-like 11 [Hibiscus trionum]|uniref:SCR-like 11 n=1 Tax=Hibiscus trionum TaxID=183268 RepID=A0A9W7ILL8_HIBTR|nr:SCR-like 11 [Hibiscus trionum]
MKKSIILPILCGLLLLALFSPSKGEIKFCPTTMQLSGPCGPNPLFECFEAINAKYGASAMTQRCSCKDLPANQHMCQCYIVCQ